jgi:hypothetical protein
MKVHAYLKSGRVLKKGLPPRAADSTLPKQTVF